ncbi:PAS domain-containing protein [Sphingomicrobium aestuariivivum]|uniref:PAS domain-containing protein n=1 Tax=Sphingomicrobium aestuariivivum TaxID=1582356 RepID=UPI001FD67AEB|nr:PAS domain-containing protein [Sphingomicrobium aestuariivivum]MCJ8191415.1 PAS domain-containing protein [Sphingomicrobium aestuariivivum]
MSDLPVELHDYITGSSLALSASPVGVEDHPLRAVSDGFCHLTGFGRDKVIGRNCRFLQGGKREQEGLGKLRAFLASKGRGMCRVNLVNFRADGTPFINMLTLTRICDHDGKDCFLFGSQFDIGRAEVDEAEEFDGQFRDVAERVKKRLDPHKLSMVGSVSALANAASAIAEAKMLVSQLEGADRLY